MRRAARPYRWNRLRVGRALLLWVPIGMIAGVGFGGAIAIQFGAAIGLRLAAGILASCVVASWAAYLLVVTFPCPRCGDHFIGRDSDGWAPFWWWWRRSCFYCGVDRYSDR